MKKLMVRFDFNKAASYWLKAYFFAMKEVFAIPTLSFLLDNVTAFTSCEQGGIKHKQYLVVFVHILYFTRFSLGLPQKLGALQMFLLTLIKPVH